MANFLCKVSAWLKNFLWAVMAVKNGEIPLGVMNDKRGVNLLLGW